MAANDEVGDRAKAGAEADRGDPLEDPTQSMSVNPSPDAPDESSSSELEDRPLDSDSLDTTTWGGTTAPPVIVDAGADEALDDTLVLASDAESDSKADSDRAADAIGASADADSMATVVSSEPPRSIKTPLAPSSSLRPMLLERIEPSLGRGERLRLDASHWKLSLGRAEQSDLRLYTASASREHAMIAGDDAGNWVLTPAEGKSVSIDGEVISKPIVLEVGMNILLGHDHLRCISEGLGRAEMKASTAAEGFDDRDESPVARLRGLNLGWWAIGLCALMGVGLIVYAMVGG